MAHECPDCDYETDVELELWQHWNEVHQPMTRDAVLYLANAAADRVMQGMDWGDTQTVDAINLVVNMLGTMIDDPDATVDEAMDANYDGGRRKFGRGGPTGSASGKDFIRVGLTQTTGRAPLDEGARDGHTAGCVAWCGARVCGEATI